MNEQIRSYILTGLLIATVFSTSFAAVVPPTWQPYLGALASALSGIASLFHAVIPKVIPSPLTEGPSK